MGRPIQLRDTDEQAESAVRIAFRVAERFEIVVEDGPDAGA